MGLIQLDYISGAVSHAEQTTNRDVIMVDFWDRRVRSAQDKTG